MERQLFGGTVRMGSSRLGNRRPVCDTVLILVVIPAVCLLTRFGRVSGDIVNVQSVVMLSVLASAVALVAGVLCSIAARLLDDRGQAWVGASFVVYGMIAVPTGTLGSTMGVERATNGSVRLVAQVTVVALLVVGASAMARKWRIPSVKLVALGVLIPVAAGAVALLDPEVAITLSSSPVARSAVSAVWLLATALVLHREARNGSPAGFRVGLGALVVALAHLIRVVSGKGDTAAAAALPSVDFSALRLLGLLVVVAGAVEMARIALHGVRDAFLDHQEELLVIEDGLASRADRDHEIRNGIAGIAGATDVLAGCAADPQRSALQTLMDAELRGLEALLVPASSRTEVEALAHQPRPR